MNNKLIFILLDGLNFDTGKKYLGFLNHLVEAKKAAFYTVKSELPAMSRPLYEVLMTGVNSSTNKVVSNDYNKKSNTENLFSLTKNASIKNGASSYYWISELYNSTPFKKDEDFIQIKNKDGLVENGIYYYEDQYPDSHVLSGGDFLVDKIGCEFVLIHTMNIDYYGHLFGSHSKEYISATIKVDSLLSRRILKWMDEGYNIIVTADHGMNEYGLHNGISDEERLVPLFIISNNIVENGDFTNILIPQLDIAPLACMLLGIDKGNKMKYSNSIKLINLN